MCVAVGWRMYSMEQSEMHIVRWHVSFFQKSDATFLIRADTNTAAHTSSRTLVAFAKVFQWVKLSIPFEFNYSLETLLRER